MMPRLPSALSVTCTFASGRSAGAFSSEWLKNFGKGRATTSPVASFTIRPRQARVVGVQAPTYWQASV